MLSAVGPGGAVVRGAALCGVALIALVGAGCDGDGAPADDLGPERAVVADGAGLGIVASDVADGVHAGHGAIHIELDRALDVASVGARSVRIERADGRRVRRVRVWANGAHLFIAPAADRSLPDGVDLTLRIEGGGSPRALRALDGTTLRETALQPFRALLRRRTDLEGPRLLASRPAAGTSDATPSSHVVLQFDEPLARAPVRASEAVIVRIDRREVPSRQRLSPDLTQLVVRPKRHLPPGAEITIEVLPALIDLAGNPAAPTTVRFRTEATRLRELTEDFVTTDMLDPGATTGGWALPESPGFLVARAGRLRWSPSEGDTWGETLPVASRVRFQTIFPSVDHGAAVASGLRVFVDGAEEGVVLAGATVHLGPTTLLRADPTFDANRGASDLLLVAAGDGPLVVESDEAGATFVDVPFDVPSYLPGGTPLLVEAALVLPTGVRIAADADPGSLALVENLGVGALLPAAELLVSGGLPQARSLWWDSGVDRPGWRTAAVGPGGSAMEEVRVEFQAAAATPEGLPDPDRTSEWASDLSLLPSLRFVRFRVTFARLRVRGEAPRLDWIVMPYQD